MAYITNIESDTLNNTFFRRVLNTEKYQQLVVMSLKPQEKIPMEVHKDSDQFFRIEKGTIMATVNGEVYHLGDGDIIMIPNGARHEIYNTSKTEPAKLYTIYSLPHHKPGTIEKEQKPEKDNSVNININNNGSQDYYAKYIKYKSKYNGLKNSF